MPVGVAFGILVAGYSIAASAITVVPPFDDAYSIYAVPSASGPTTVPGIPNPYSALAFRPGDNNTLLMAGYSYHDDGSGADAVYAIPVTRDANHHIVNFAGNGKKIAYAPGRPGTGAGIGAAITFRTSSMLFYTSALDNGLNMIGRGHHAPDHQIDLGAGPTPIIEGAGMTFVPGGLPGAGRLKLAELNSGNIFDLTLVGTGTGLADVGTVQKVGTLTHVGPDGMGNSNLVTSLVYEQGGNPHFPKPVLLAGTYDFNTAAASTLVAYDLDAKGNPIISTARTVLDNAGFTGATVDPVTGDVIFTTFYGFPALVVLTGFTVPPSAALVTFKGPALNALESQTSQTIEVMRVGDLQSALTVQFHTTAGTAVNGVNYDDVSGTLSWTAGQTGSRTFTVPIHDDGKTGGPRTVNLSLVPSVGPAPAPAVLSIYNVDPKP